MNWSLFLWALISGWIAAWWIDRNRLRRDPDRVPHPFDVFGPFLWPVASCFRDSAGWRPTPRGAAYGVAWRVLVIGWFSVLFLVGWWLSGFVFERPALRGGAAGLFVLLSPWTVVIPAIVAITCSAVLWAAGPLFRLLPDPIDPTEVLRAELNRERLDLIPKPVGIFKTLDLKKVDEYQERLEPFLFEFDAAGVLSSQQIPPDLTNRLMEAAEEGAFHVGLDPAFFLGFAVQFVEADPMMRRLRRDRWVVSMIGRPNYAPSFEQIAQDIENVLLGGS